MNWLTLYNFDPAPPPPKPGAPPPPPESGHAAWHRLSHAWKVAFPKEEQQLGWMTHAAYAIAIRIPFTIAYPKDHSPIVYIGEGMAHARFKEHLAEKLLPMLATRLPAKFDFWVLPCDDKPMVVATEAAMLRSFEETYGGRPLFNIQSGKSVDAEPHKDWFVPLDQRRRGKRHWKLERV